MSLLFASNVRRLTVHDEKRLAIGFFFKTDPPSVITRIPSIGLGNDMIDTSNLGALEIAVLEHIWLVGETDVKAAHAEIGVERGITLNTVQSTLKRLYEKDLLTRKKESHAYIYGAAVSRSELTERLMGSVIEQIAGSEFNVALEAFVNLADRAGDETLDAMERLIAARRAEGGDA